MTRFLCVVSNAAMESPCSPICWTVSVRVNTPLTDLIRSGFAAFTTIDGMPTVPASSRIGLGAKWKNSEGARQVPLPNGMTLARHRELFAVRFAHSHSGSQFLPHFPSHWYSDILPPHCGQTRLRIDERMRTFNSPGGASMVIMFEVSPRSGEGQKRGQNDGGYAALVLCAL